MLGKLSVQMSTKQLKVYLLNNAFRLTMTEVTASVSIEKLIQIFTTTELQKFFWEIILNDIEFLKQQLNSSKIGAKESLTISKDGEGYTLLMFAIKTKKIAAIQLLLGHRKTNSIEYLAQQNIHGETALIIAAKQNDINTVKMLSENGLLPTILVNQRDRFGLSALFYACQLNDNTIASLLLEHEANVNVIGSSLENSIMHLLVSSQKLKLLQQIFSKYVFYKDVLNSAVLNEIMASDELVTIYHQHYVSRRMNDGLPIDLIFGDELHALSTSYLRHLTQQFYSLSSHVSNDEMHVFFKKVHNRLRHVLPILKQAVLSDEDITTLKRAMSVASRYCCDTLISKIRQHNEYQQGLKKLQYNKTNPQLHRWLVQNNAFKTKEEKKHSFAASRTPDKASYHEMIKPIQQSLKR